MSKVIFPVLLHIWKKIYIDKYSGVEIQINETKKLYGILILKSRLWI